MNTPRNRVPFLALITTLLISTAGFAAGVREAQLDSTYTAEVFKRDGSVAATGNLALGSNKITGLADGTDPGDAVNKSQLDAVSGGLFVKEPTRVHLDSILDDNTDLTAAAPVYSNTGGASSRGQITAVLAVSGTFAIDGVSLSNGDRILVSGEGLGGGLGGDANGCYTPTIAGTALTLDRCTDFDEDAEVVSGSYFFNQEGTVHANHSHVLSTADPITIGGASGTSLSFVQYTTIELGSSTPTTVNGGDAGAVGSSGSAAREDHEHPVATATAGTIQPDDAAAEGTSTSLARADHAHAIAAAIAGTIQPDDAAAEGSATSFSRSDHQHAIAAAAASAAVDAGDTSLEGSSTSFARADHQHAVSTAAPSAAQTPDQANAEGSATTLARSDHTHNIPAATAVSVTTANAEGTDSSFARSDHEHDSPQPTDADKAGTPAATTGTNQDTTLNITNTPALASYIRIHVNGIGYNVGDGVDTSDFYYSGDACTTPRALSAIVAGDDLCTGDNLPFNLAVTDELDQDYLTFTNN